MAAVLYGKEHVEVERVAMPELGPGDALVRVRAALTCGTDVKTFRRGYHAMMLKPPIVFGHELAGDVVARAAYARSAFVCGPTSARICCSTTELTRSTFASPPALSRRTRM
jgi:threonine dehydrogenase-like Zn-dependent dehydrogenase